MMKHIFGQAIYMFTILMILTFSADRWFPETLPSFYDPRFNTDVYRSRNIKFDYLTEF
jgi:hypothetical protein